MSKYSDASPFVEAQALLASQENDHQELERLMANMLPGELRDLANAADQLSEYAWRTWRAKIGRADTPR